MTSLDIVKMNEMLVDLLNKIHESLKNKYIDPTDVKLLEVLLNTLNK